MKKVIVTADDFGLSEDINAGIVEAHRNGIVTAASLLVNAPATLQAVELARQHPGLQVGLHLSVVEGISLRGRHGSLTDDTSYFGAGPCLHRDWRVFIMRLAGGRIRFGELAEELELQAQAFTRMLGPIPFANSTQHLHLLPGVAALVRDIAVRHAIPTLRTPFRFGDPRQRGTRAGQAVILGMLSRRARSVAFGAGLAAPDTCMGFAFSGRLDTGSLIDILNAVPEGTTEIMAHPGNECAWLRERLPGSYGTFNWALERSALMSPEVRDTVKSLNLDLVGFAQPPQRGDGRI
jgi:predicted glycoside hydrolase/deacetylase ChbG (UPF0249 family)